MRLIGFPEHDRSQIINGHDAAMLILPHAYLAVERGNQFRIASRNAGDGAKGGRQLRTIAIAMVRDEYLQDHQPWVP